ncbi:hypothetical protein GBA52_015027 [Prunus armeniaca]|nr:hypothetical protein GBA52_015027 [Prunus armeniaca]
MEPNISHLHPILNHKSHASQMLSTFATHPLYNSQLLIIFFLPPYNSQLLISSSYFYTTKYSSFFYSASHLFFTVSPSMEQNIPRFHQILSTTFADTHMLIDRIDTKDSRLARLRNTFTPWKNVTKVCSKLLLTREEGHDIKPVESKKKSKGSSSRNP